MAQQISVLSLPKKISNGASLVSTVILLGLLFNVAHGAVNVVTSNYIVDSVFNKQPNPLGSNGYTLRMANNGERVYMLDSTKGAYQQFNLKGRSFSFSVNLKNIECGYNLAVYFSQMNPNSKPGGGYCDAQGSPGCFEFDALEANRVAAHAANHSCKPDRSCDRGGQVAKFRWSDIGFDVSRDINVATTFSADKITQTYSQSGKSSKTVTISDSNGGTEYGGVRALNSAWDKGMTLVLSLWTAGSNNGMSWLDGGCNNYTPPNRAQFTGVVNNIRVN